MRYLILTAPLLIAACTTTPQPAVQVRTVEVPVPQPCLSEEDLEQDKYQEPPLVGSLLGRTPETAAADRDKLGQSALLLRAWGKGLLAAHVACATKTEQE